MYHIGHWSLPEMSPCLYFLITDTLLNLRFDFLACGVVHWSPKEASILLRQDYELILICCCLKFSLEFNSLCHYVRANSQDSMSLGSTTVVKNELTEMYVWWFFLLQSSKEHRSGNFSSVDFTWFLSMKSMTSFPIIICISLVYSECSYLFHLI